MLALNQTSHQPPRPLRDVLPPGCAHKIDRSATSSVADCDARDLSELREISKQVTACAKSVLFDEGTPADAVLNIRRGEVLLSKTLPDGRRQVLGIALPGDFVGLASAERHGFTATALSEVEFCCINRRLFSKLLDEQPRLLKFVFETRAEELTMAQDHLMLLGRCTSEEKVACFLLKLRERWAKYASPSPRVDLSLTRQDIGDYLGLTMETVSRVFSKFAKRKLIAIIPNGIRILDIGTLEAIAAA